MGTSTGTYTQKSTLKSGKRGGTKAHGYSEWVEHETVTVTINTPTPPLLGTTA